MAAAAGGPHSSVRDVLDFFSCGNELDSLLLLSY